MSFTREEMRNILREGKSVFHGQGLNRRIISREEDLPSERELASGNRDGLVSAREALSGRVDKLNAEIAAIDHELSLLGSMPAQDQTTQTDEPSRLPDAEESSRVEHGSAVEDAKRAGDGTAGEEAKRAGDGTASAAKKG